MLIEADIQAQAIIDSVKKASAVVLDIYTSSEQVDVDYKSDNSPVTTADIMSHEILVESLTQLTPTIPIVSEEQDTQINGKNIMSDLYWLIDPIDGTKEFIAQNGQFTICVALMKAQNPVFGIVSAPALQTLYYGGKAYNSYKITADGLPTNIERVIPNNIVYGSLSHTNKATADYIHVHYPDCKQESVGSQLKIVYVAEGRAKAYPRIGSTMKTWDIAAGHAILEGAGGAIIRPNGDDIDYANKELLAGDFIAIYRK